MESSDKLCVIWTSADPETARNMAFMYAFNSKVNGWWSTVRIIVWGPSQTTLLDDPILQEAVEECTEAGIEMWACKACSDRYDAGEDLEALGVEVLYTGEALTEMLKSGWTVLTV